MQVSDSIRLTRTDTRTILSFYFVNEQNSREDMVSEVPEPRMSVVLWRARVKQAFKEEMIIVDRNKAACAQEEDDKLPWIF